MLSLRKTLGDLRQNLKSRRRVVITCLGVFLIIVAIVGLLIPLIPTSLVAIPGLLLISLYSPTVYSFMKRKTQGSPKLQSRMDRMRNWLINFIHPSN